jgi:two-component sensor histidine kinase
LAWVGRLDLPGQWKGWLPRTLTSVLVGTVLCGLALLIRGTLQLVWPTAVPFGFLFPMILLATLMGRWLGGLTCFLLGGTVIWFRIRPGLVEGGFLDAQTPAILILYLLAGGTMLLIAVAYRREHQALVREQALRADAETEHQRLLAQELSHRIKNMLATIQAIAAQTLKTPGVDEAARKVFEDRLVALARAHDLLTSVEWTGVPLDQLVSTALSPFEDGHRFQIDGPALLLPPRQAIAFALALHELATNALKYGALASAKGHVQIGWQPEGAGFRLSWLEQDGPPVAAPDREGFGMRLLKRNLASEISGEIRIDYAPAGVRCEIIAPLLSDQTQRSWLAAASGHQPNQSGSPQDPGNQ